MSDQLSTTTFKLEDFFSPEMVKMIRKSDEFQKKIGSVNGTLNKSFGGIGGKFSAFAQKHEQMISGISNAIPGLGGSLSMLANPYAAAGAAALAVGGAYIKSAQMAQEWEKSMAQVNVTAQLTPKELKQVSDQILNIGKRSRTDLMEVPGAFNTIISAGMDVNQSMRALEPTLAAAGAGFTDIKTTADAAVSVMNSSGIADATKVYDVLFATMNKGKAEFKDIAQYLPKIVPASRNVGLSLEETAGAYAYFTAQGQSAERSATLLENSFKVLGSPDKVKRFKAIGVSLYDNKGKIMPLVSIAEQLNKKLTGLSDLAKSKVLASLGLDMEAGAAFASLSQDVGKLKDTIDFTTNSQGQLDNAVRDSATSGDIWQQVLNEGKAAMISIGQTALPIWQSIGQGVMDAINWVRNLYNESVMFRDIVSGIGNVFSWLWKIQTIVWRVMINAVQGVWNSIKLVGNSLDILGQKLGLGKNGFSNLYNTARPYLLFVWELLSKIANIGFKVATLDFKGAFNDLKNFKLPDIDRLKKDTALEIAKNGKKDDSIMAVTGGDKKGVISNVIKAAGGKPLGDKTVGGGTGTGRNVQVTINKLVEKIEVHVIQQGRDSYREIERTITEVLTKAVRDSEIALSTD